MYRMLLALTLLASGCIEDRVPADDPAPDEADAARAGDARVVDASSAADAVVPRDAEPPPPDRGPSPGGPLARALRCDLSEDAALRATVRWVACAAQDDRSTVTGLMEGWAAGLFGTGDPFARQLSSQMLGLGCDRWQCLADALDCDAARACRSGPPPDPEPAPDVECEPGRAYCQGNAVIACDDGLTRLLLDCTPLGMTCQHAPGSGRTFCASDACQTVLGVNELICDGDRLTACEGTLAIDCETLRPGSRCQSFAIGGEVPINFCGPEGFGGAGAYATPVDCADDGVITFTALQVDEYRFDCRAAGYAGCDERGCVE